MEDIRLKHTKPLNYNKKVLIGNWFEAQCSYSKNKFNHVTEYSEEYKRKPLSTNPASVVWDAGIKSEGHGFYPVNITEEFPNYYENFSSMCDLSYNHFPNFILRRSPVPKSEPLEYIKSYGNITKYGICDYKTHEWKCDQEPQPYTTNELTYVYPEHDSYYFNRWTRPTPVRVKYGKDHRPYPSHHPRFSKFDPITWEIKSTPTKKC